MVFVHDRSTGATQRVSLSSTGAQAANYSEEPSVSADGRYVTFWSRASNLVGDDTNGAGDVFVHDRSTGATQRVSVDSTGGQANDYSWGQSVSADGRYVAFRSRASNLVADDTNNRADVFMHDRSTGATQLVSLTTTGAQANGGSWGPSISADGFVAFTSPASNLVADDTNNSWDVFVRDRGGP